MPKPTLEIVLPLPSKAASPNARGHWVKKHRAIKAQRSDGFLGAFAAKRRQKPKGLPWKRATVLPIFYFRTNRRRDLDNLLASLKAYLDSLQDAGIIENDSGLVPLTPQIRFDKANPRLLLIVEKAEKSP